ncbi:hypothetical protein ACVWYN_001454 [Pedobacter sp. UYP24]
MKIISLLLFTFCFQTSFSQGIIYPKMLQKNKAVKKLIPPQWKVIDSVRGDLNGDNAEDLAMVLEFYAAVKEPRAYGDNETELITEIQRPRILAIYFKSGKNYELASQNNNFILRSEEGGGMGDPLRPMAIKDNKLSLNFEGGSNWKWKLSYSFKFNNQEWQLANARNYSFHDGTGELNDKVYDFINKTSKVVSGTISNKKNANTTVNQPIKLNKLKTFASFKKPWTWEIKPGEFL